MSRKIQSWWLVPCPAEECPGYLCVRLELLRRCGLAEKWASAVTELGTIVACRVEVTHGFDIGHQA